MVRERRVVFLGDGTTKVAVATERETARLTAVAPENLAVLCNRPERLVGDPLSDGEPAQSGAGAARSDESATVTDDGTTVLPDGGSTAAADDEPQLDEGFRVILEQVDDAVFLKDRDGKYRYINRAGAALFDREQEGVIGKTDADLFDERTAQEIRNEDEHVLQTGESRTSEAAREYAGEERAFQTVKHPYERDGEIRGVIGIARDVTERREREAALREARERVEEVLERVEEAVIGLDEDWTITYVNPRAAEVTDRDRDALLGRTLWTAFPEISGTIFEAEYRAAMANQEVRTFESYYDPLESWLEVTVYPAEDGLSVYVRDVTDQRRTEMELERNEQALRDLQRLAASTDRTLDEKFDRALSIGCDRLDLPLGFLTNIESGNQRIIAADSDHDQLQPGAEVPLSEAYCRKTIESEGLLGIEYAAEEGWADDPAYDRFGLDCYLGGKVLVDGELFGTLCFAATDERERAFSEAERTFIELLIEWVSYELERRERERDLERYETIVRSVDDGVYELDAEGRFRFVNPAMAHLTGYEPEELAGEHVSFVRDDDETATAVDALLSGTADEQTVEGALQRKRGPPIVCEDSMTRLTDDDGTVRGVVGVVRDVTEQREQREMLSQLVTSSRTLMQARDREEVAELVAGAVAEVLGFDLTAVRLFDRETDRLVPVGITESADEQVSNVPAYDLGEGGPGRAFVEGETLAIADTGEIDDEYERETIGSVLHLPMGVHGTLSIGATEPGEFSDVDRQAAELLATSAAAAANRAKREEEVREARERVDTLIDRINGLIENTVEVLVQSGTREQLEDGVVEQLVVTDPYAFAWIGQPDVAAETLEATACEGEYPSLRRLLADHAIDRQTAREAGDPTALALADDQLQVANLDALDLPDDSVHVRAREAGLDSMIAVPLTYKDASYGVLTVYAERRDAFSEREQIVLNALGRAIANAVNAIESGRILTTNRVVEMEFTVQDDALLFNRLSAQLDAPVELTGSVYQSDGNLRLYVSCEGDPDAVRSIVEADESVVDASVIADHEDELLVEITVAESLIERLADYGAVTQSVSATDGVVRYTIELPYEAEAREVFEFVADDYQGTDLVRYREHERPVQTRQEFREAVTERFTDRQETAVRTAFLGGFFEWPREVDGDDLAESMDISRPTYHQHLRAAQRKVFEELFGNYTDRRR